MGVDLVELVIEVEKAFGIAILDEDAGNIITVGQLYDYVVAKLPAQETECCLTATAFYQFRSALTGQFGVDRREVRPSALVGIIVREPTRRRTGSFLVDVSIGACPPRSACLDEIGRFSEFSWAG